MSFTRYQTYEIGVLMIRDSTDTPDTPSSAATAPPFCCAITVTTHDAADSIKKGSFLQKQPDGRVRSAGVMG